MMVMLKRVMTFAPNAIAPHPWLTELEAALARVARDGDSTAVHRLRVSAGRMAALLELGGRRALLDDLRWLRRTVARVRDADVTMAGNVHDARHAQLSERRARAWEAACLELNTPRAPAVLRALSCVPWPTAAEAHAFLTRAGRRALKAGESVVNGHCSVAELHRLRRRVRKFRYVLEWLGHDATHLRELQDVLGTLNDLAITAAELDSREESEVDMAELNALERRQQALIERALDLWTEHAAEIVNATRTAHS